MSNLLEIMNECFPRVRSSFTNSRTPRTFLSEMVEQIKSNVSVKPNYVSAICQVCGCNEKNEKYETVDQAIEKQPYK